MKPETLYHETITRKTVRGEVVGLIDEMSTPADLISVCGTKREEDLAYGLIMTNWIWEHGDVFCKSCWLDCYAELLTKRPKKDIQFDNLLDKYCSMDVKDESLTDEEVAMIHQSWANGAVIN